MVRYDQFFVTFIHVSSSEGSSVSLLKNYCKVIPLANLGLLHKVGWALGNE